MPQTKLFRIGYGILLIFLIIFMGTKINFIFRPIAVIIQTLFTPFLVAGVLYYLFRPLVSFLESKKMRRSLSIFLIYLVAASIIFLIVYNLGPILQRQTTSLINNAPYLLESARLKIIELEHNEWINRFQTNGNLSLANLSDQAYKYLSFTLSNLGSNVVNIIGIVTSIVTVFVTVPFILFYMLKEGENIPKLIVRFLPTSQRDHGYQILLDLDKALSSYIQGQIFISMCVGVMLYIGYVIIGIDYSLVLAIVAMLVNVIPFLGPIIASIPAIIVAFLMSPAMVVKVLIVVIIAHQIEGNIISPQIMGRSLSIHPLTIISLLLVSGSLAGVLGLILAIPTYAVLKVIVQHMHRLWKLRKEQNMNGSVK
ncbi:AI-2E family transporter [Ectobacillus sp. sgz5001026]|uniref:AI-2E family transporter n=1 Tax=Ectobacillus sp. sgz5001026 TaxID=3242473 RepID=UPI0036D3BBCC